MAKKTTKNTEPEVEPQNLAKREYTDEDKARIEKYRERAKKEPVKFKLDKSGKNKRAITFEDPDDDLKFVKFFEATGTPDSELQSHLIGQAVEAFKGAADDQKLPSLANSALAILNGIQPQDELEGMLAVQMVGVHNMAMDCIGRATRTDRVDFMSTYMSGATKMLRTFTAQMEALKNYRTGGQQKMTVEHVHVNEGGQAIVGTVNQGGGIDKQ